MLYATTKERFRRELDGVHYEIQATDPTEMDLEVLRDRAHWDVYAIIDFLIKIYYFLLLMNYLSLIYLLQNPSCHKNVPPIIWIWILEADDGFKLLAATVVYSSLLYCIVWAWYYGSRYLGH